ncbi:MAG TPA: hypothetical protein VMT76_09975 [Puia sp.]|nr:hypothetical protein [Puia sp.]
MRIMVNNDSYNFLGAAIAPSYLFHPNYFRQSRPIFIILGTITCYSVYFLSSPMHTAIHSIINKKIQDKYLYTQIKHPIELYACAFIGYLLINLLAQWISFLLFDYIITSLPGTWQNGRS